MSFHSAPHGAAGDTPEPSSQLVQHGRSQPRHGRDRVPDSKVLLDEIPGAYKDIDEDGARHRPRRGEVRPPSSS